ncbi:NAD(P)/FAD-dependent oxidoreductase [Marinococcus sp. PL1-022]|uniref:NAD(P)/FAD-dependent oxidoreductase n=1 Tax=Marinococcus sp. PL1-022 TaxID=3095363 RepID=UPI0029C122BC|nr:NAD(P)/FAD-dependent oxidoreductase [Marinococcus sp. PL1-022]MDX6153081.1 NAD(P)/FAD-dependent oxidoreductase [Marinococcus sp. PL1-022]
MMYDVVIIGGGPAGLSAALYFGRGLKRALIIDEDRPRNIVTHETHSYLTQDRVTPQTFRKRSREDALKYEGNTMLNDRVTAIHQHNDGFIVQTPAGQFQSKQMLVASGLIEQLPAIKNIEHYYGQSVFYCPWCDGWEMRNKKLAVINPDERVLHMVMLLSNWTNQLEVFTDGYTSLTDENKKILEDKNIPYHLEKIEEMSGENGQLQAIRMTNGETVEVEGAFTYVHWNTNYEFLSGLDVERDENSRFVLSQFGETSVKGLYVAGEAKDNFGSQLIAAAANGGEVARFMMMTQIQEAFNKEA